MNDIKFQVEYYKHGELSHSHTEIWIKTPLYCPNCGCIKVWKDSGEGDFYVGELYLCVKCEFSFHLPLSGKASGDQNEQRLRVLGVAEEKRGRWHKSQDPDKW